MSRKNQFRAIVLNVREEVGKIQYWKLASHDLNKELVLDLLDRSSFIVKEGHKGEK